MKHARNIAIIVALAVAVVAVPGGSDTAGLVGAILSVAIVALIAYFAGRFYRDHQVDIYGLGDRDRMILYVAIGAIVLLLAASGRLTSSSPGTLVEIAGLAICAGGLLRVFRNWQRY
jgi:Kef-type K+ transport system membrane component KefB